MWWLDDLLHELGTVGLGAFFLFIISVFCGYLLRTPRLLPRTAVFRWINVCSALAGSFAVFFFLVPECMECAFAAEIFVLVFSWGLQVGFEKRWIFGDFFSREFWFSSMN